MNKILLLISLMGISLTNYAQMPTNAKGEVEYSEVIEVNGISKDVLYDRAKLWLATSYKSAKDVIQVESKEAGNITGKAAFNISFKGGAQVPGYYTLMLDVKDGKYRYMICQIHYLNQGMKQEAEQMNKGFEKNKYKQTFIAETNEHVQALVANLKSSMITNNKNDW